MGMLMVSIRFQKIKQILKLILVILLIVLAVVLIKGWIGTGDDAPKEPSAQNVDAVKPNPKMLPQEYLKCCGLGD